MGGKKHKKKTKPAASPAVRPVKLHVFDRPRTSHHWQAALEVDEARRGDPLGVLDKAIEGTARRHQAGELPSMHMGNHPR